MTRVQDPQHPNQPVRQAKRAIFIGGQSLLRHCVEYWQEVGHSVVAVISDEASLHQWSAEKLITCFKRQEAYKLSALPAFDFLFSVVNLEVTPLSVLQQARVAAINFHDGLLPEYGGLNVTNWALLNGETSHGITWHKMEQAVDCGGVLLTETFPIAPDETAFTLNAKCFQAGVESFKRLVVTLMQEKGIDSAAAPQSLKRYYRARQRPLGTAVVTWSASGESLERLARALDFGGYVNSLSLPKFYCQQQWFCCRHMISVSALVEPAPPAGTVLEVTESYVRVACGDAVMQISDLCTLYGEAVKDLPRRFQPGMRLIEFAADDLHAVTRYA